MCVYICGVLLYGMAVSAVMYISIVFDGHVRDGVALYVDICYDMCCITLYVVV